MFIDFHALQTLAPSNINRGEDGSPKTAYFGGVLRQRVSSQALKAAQRRDFSRVLDTSELGVRTKRIVEQLAQLVVAHDPSIDMDVALNRSADVFTKAGIKVEKPKKKATEESVAAAASYLVFLGNYQLERLAQTLVAKGDEPFTKKEALQIIDSEHAIDVALFGRMIAEEASLNVDAAIQMAHAIGIHEAMPDFDYFTAVDDKQREEEQAGAGMIGTVELMSSTLYRYATLNVEMLYKNLGSTEATLRAIEAFAITFVESLPSGKQNTFASHTLPFLVNVVARDNRPVSYVNAFENPIESTRENTRRELAVQQLAREATFVESAFGAAPLAGWALTRDDLAVAAAPLGERVTLPELIENIKGLISEHLDVVEDSE